MRKIFTLFCCAIFLLCSPDMAKAQSSPVEEHIFYVQADDLNVDNYASLHHKLKSDGRFTINTACIPAHVMVVKVIGTALISATPDANFELFKAMALESEINQIHLLQNYSNQAFEDQCRSARTGN